MAEAPAPPVQPSPSLPEFHRVPLTARAPKCSFRLATSTELNMHIKATLRVIVDEGLAWFSNHQRLPDLRGIAELRMVDALHVRADTILRIL